LSGPSALIVPVAVAYTAWRREGDEMA
jgi:hypothetical protein